MSLFRCAPSIATPASSRVARSGPIGIPIPLRLGLVSALVVGLAACASAPLLWGLDVSPSAITPNRDGDRDVARIRYHIGRPARVQVELEASDGTVFVVREDKPRAPDDESYEILFGGVLGERMLPDGDYELRIRASPLDGGPDETERATLQIHDGDAEPPSLGGFSVQPSRFTPNQDGLDDRVAISYRLDEPAEMSLRLLTEDGEWVADILESLKSASEPGEPGPHVYDYDAGVDADAPPPPDGRYLVEAVARDSSGNVARASRPLEIANGGRPRAALMGDVQWSARRLVIGETLRFTATVKNVGGTPIRTRGPEPGFVYSESATFNQSAPPGFLLLTRTEDGRVASLLVPPDAGSVRLEVAKPDGAPVPSPRWPNQDAETSDPITRTGRTVSLCGVVVDAVDQRPIEGVTVHAFQSDGDKGQAEVTDEHGAFCYDALSLAEPHALNYARSPGALRIGVEHDARRGDVDHPWRWQVGPTTALHACEAERETYLCLPPGTTVTVGGGIRFDEPIFGTTFQMWLTLMHEDVRRMHGPYQPEQLFLDYGPSDLTP